jgi:hypothetical protein
MMGIDCDIDLQEHRMVRSASRLGCRLQIRSFPLSAEAIALLWAEAKFVVGQAIQDRCGEHPVANDAPPSPWMLGRRWAVQKQQNNAHNVGKDRQRQDDRRERVASRPDVRAEG